MKETKTSETMGHIKLLEVAQASGSVAAKEVIINFVTAREERLTDAAWARPVAKSSTPVAA